MHRIYSPYPENMQYQHLCYELSSHDTWGGSGRVVMDIHQSFTHANFYENKQVEHSKSEIGDIKRRNVVRMLVVVEVVQEMFGGSMGRR